MAAKIGCVAPGAPTHPPKLLEEHELAERVGFGLLPLGENKELSGLSFPHDPLETLKSPGRRTYCARGAIYPLYMAYWPGRLAHAPNRQGLLDQP